MLSFLGNIVSAGIAAGSQANTNQAQFKQDMSLAEYEFERNKEMWELENEYNSPKNQMARFRDAGLNPHLMYGSVNSGNSTSVPSYSAPSPPVVGSGISDIIQNSSNNLVQTLLAQKQLDSQVDLNRSLANKNDAEADSIRGVKADETAARTSLLGEQTETQKHQTLYWASKALSEKANANVSEVVASLSVAKEYQNLRNLSAEEKQALADVAYKEASVALAKSHVSLNEWKQALDKEELELKKQYQFYQQQLIKANIAGIQSGIIKTRIETTKDRIRQIQELWVDTQELMLENSRENRAKIKFHYDNVKGIVDSVVNAIKR